MKAVGIIRNIDNLGRVVIPMELRKALNISTGDPVEIFTDEGGRIVMRKYQLNGALAESLSDLQNVIDVYGGQLPGSVLIAMRQHVSEMQKLIDQE